MGQTTIVLMLITILSKILGFVRESVMAAYIGAGELKSIYTTATTVPTMLTGVVATGIVSGYIPMYNRINNDKGHDEASKFTSNLINILMIYGAIIFLLVFIFAKPINLVLSPDLEGDNLRISVNYTRIIIISIFALLYASVTRGYLNIKGNFIDPAISGIILNIFIITATILSAIFSNPYILIIGALLAFIFQFIRFPFAAKKLGFVYNNEINFNNYYIKQLMVIVIPIIISTAADQISIIVDNSMASAFFGVSSISKIFYAKTMLNFIMSVVTLSVTTVTFPDIASAGQKGDIRNLRKMTSSAIIFAMLLVVPFTLGMMVLSKPIISLAFERSAFSGSDTVIVASLLVCYAPFIIFSSLIKLISNAFYSLGDSKTPLVVILIQQLLNLILNYFLAKKIGLNGLAISTSISTIIGSILLLLAFYKKIGKPRNNSTSKSLIEILLLSMIISYIAKMLFDYMTRAYNSTISLFVSVLVAGIIYLVGIFLFKIPEFINLLNSYIERRNNRNNYD